MPSKNILLFGGTGFLARHIRRVAAAEGDTTFTIVTRTCPTTPLLTNESWLSFDAFRSKSASAVAAMQQCDAVIYAATTSIPNLHEHAPSSELTENVRPAMEFFEEVGTRGLSPRIVLLSSGGTIYGYADGEEAVGEAVSVRPFTAYGFGSHLVEQTLQFANTRHGIPYSILRVANPVGLFQNVNGHGLVPAILRCVREGKPVPVYGDGLSVRDYFDADDLGRAVLMAASDTTNRSNLWNVGAGIGRSVVDIIDLIRHVTGASVAVEFLPQRKTDIRKLVLDCGKIRRELGWSATTDLRKTIAEMWNTNPF